MLLANSGYAQQNDFPELTGPYLGQTPPGARPEMFAPGIISVEENFEHSAAFFSPDGNRLYIEFGSDPYSESDTDIYVVTRTADGWFDPTPVSPLINSPAIERLHCVSPRKIVKPPVTGTL